MTDATASAACSHERRAQQQHGAAPPTAQSLSGVGLRSHLRSASHCAKEKAEVMVELRELLRITTERQQLAHEQQHHHAESGAAAAVTEHHTDEEPPMPTQQEVTEEEDKNHAAETPTPTQHAREEEEDEDHHEKTVVVTATLLEGLHQRMDALCAEHDDLRQFVVLQQQLVLQLQGEVQRVQGQLQFALAQLGQQRGRSTSRHTSGSCDSGSEESSCGDS
eukprot:TRINITY_DN1252_c0_g2_i1.p1 TRINITY_DN1252_c0_g2~~TRINITY_DN1252_c0_g2_i1.p1  ORF type:complete len:221 (+),score=85.17 TRINITY_DN1252_c0_g2_i1:1665-2327(+)